MSNSYRSRRTIDDDDSYKSKTGTQINDDDVPPTRSPSRSMSRKTENSRSLSRKTEDYEIPSEIPEFREKSVRTVKKSSDNSNKLFELQYVVLKTVILDNGKVIYICINPLGKYVAIEADENNISGIKTRKTNSEVIPNSIITSEMECRKNSSCDKLFICRDGICTSKTTSSKNIEKKSYHIDSTGDFSFELDGLPTKIPMFTIEKIFEDGEGLKNGPIHKTEIETKASNELFVEKSTSEINQLLEDLEQTKTKLQSLRDNLPVLNSAKNIANSNELKSLDKAIAEDNFDLKKQSHEHLTNISQSTIKLQSIIKETIENTESKISKLKSNVEEAVDMLFIESRDDIKSAERWGLSKDITNLTNDEIIKKSKEKNSSKEIKSLALAIKNSPKYSMSPDDELRTVKKSLERFSREDENLSRKSQRSRTNSPVEE